MTVTAKVVSGSRRKALEYETMNQHTQLWPLTNNIVTHAVHEYFQFSSNGNLAYLCHLYVKLAISQEELC